MGVTDQKMNARLFGEDIKKPDRSAKSLAISKKNIFFIIFAVITLQGADTVILWLMGARSTSSSGDSFMFSAVVFGILKCVYDKCFSKRGQVCKDDAEPTGDEEEDCRKSATYVVDTMKVKGPPRSSAMKANKRNQNPTTGCEATIWVSSWWRPQCLSAKATKFTPVRTYRASTLNSDSPVFVPHEFAMKEEELLKSQSGEAETGEVVYRSKHWLNEIGSPNDELPPEPKAARNLTRSSKPCTLQKAKKSQPKKWVPKPSA